MKSDNKAMMNGQNAKAYLNQLKKEIEDRKE